MQYVLCNFEKDVRLFDLLQYYHQDISSLNSTQVSKVRKVISPLHLAVWDNQTLVISLLLKEMTKIKVKSVFPDIMEHLIEFDGFSEYFSSIKLQTP